MGCKLLTLAMLASLVACAASQSMCGTAVATLSPCGTYLLGGGTAQHPTTECCAGLQRLSGMVNSPGARREVCQCLKETGPSFGVRPDRAHSLPSLCNVKLPIPVSPDVDCNKV